MGQVLQAGVGQAPPARRRSRRAPGHHERDHDQPGLRLGPQGDHARRRGDPCRGRGGRRRRRHGEHERGAVPAAPGPLRLSPGQRDARRLDRRRRPVVRGREVPYGHPRRARRDSRQVSREDQDEFALRSHQNAIAAIDEGRFDAEIAPGDRPRREGPRDDRQPSTRARGGIDDRGARQAQAGLRSARRRGPRRRDEGTVTAGNAPGITDGAAATVVRQRADSRADGLKPLARIVGYAQAEIEPEVAVPRPRRGRPPAARSDRDAHRGIRPDRDQRGVRGPDAGRRPASSASTGTRSTSTAARSPSVTQSARPEPGSSRRCSTSSSGARAATAWRRYASAAAGRWRWPSSGSADQVEAMGRSHRPFGVGTRDARRHQTGHARGVGLVRGDG